MTAPGEDDLRALLDPLQTLLVARPKWRTIPARDETPAPTPEMPDPPQVVIPARVEPYTDPADLPPSLLVDGRVDLAAQIALVQSAVAWLWGELQLRAVTGRITVTGGPLGIGAWAAGAEMTRAIAWDQVPLRTPTGVVVQIEAGILSAGKTSAVVVPESITDTGCEVLLRNISAGPVIVTAQQPITYTAQGLYLFIPPFEETP